MPDVHDDCDECGDWTHVGHPASAYWPDLHPNYHHPDCSRYTPPPPGEDLAAQARARKKDREMSLAKQIEELEETLRVYEEASLWRAKHHIAIMAKYGKQQPGEGFEAFMERQIAEASTRAAGDRAANAGAQRDARSLGSDVTILRSTVSRLTAALAAESERLTAERDEAIGDRDRLKTMAIRAVETFGPIDEWPAQGSGAQSALDIISNDRDEWKRRALAFGVSLNAAHTAAKMWETNARLHAAAATAGRTFEELRAANVERNRVAFGDNLGDTGWNACEWVCALVGEVGEAANLIKKVRRGEAIPLQLIADELADVQTYLDLLAAKLGIDLGAATFRKFNVVSERVGSDIRLPERG
jgi:NTP pyrophosphatase (non-canonical NTP hydrolase)